ncbi:MAG: diadenylate cyclase CdaA [Oscillospiraceae bacterium]|jgi:diadenylate cyclase|nr:diadenylate cyclase CdaA [Oscillospiraceae bacterium]
MLTYLNDILDNLISIIKTMGIVDFLEILLLSYLVYKLLRLVRETRSEQLLRGIVVVVLILFITQQFDLRALGFLSETFFSIGLMAIIVMFQPELRRVLEKMGRTKVVQTLAFNLVDARTDMDSAIEKIAASCEKLSRTATGAIIVMERQTKLGEQADTGIILNAAPSVELFASIFFLNSPLHDGAVIVRDGVILAAGCFLPKPQNEEFISKDLGTRHRAAIGMSEISDAIVIVVSEQTGIISVAENGTLRRSLDRAALTKILSNTILKDSDNGAPKQKRAKKRGGKTKEMA